MNDETKDRTSVPNDDSDVVVAELVRTAGRRPEAPAVDAALVKSAALVQWHRTVRQERRRKLLWRGGGLLAAAALAWWVVGSAILPHLEPGVSPIEAAILEAATAPLWSTDADGADRRLLLVGEALAEGRMVETRSGGGGEASGQAPRALFRLAGGTSLRVDSDTRLHFRTASQIDLLAGAIYADSGPESEGAAIEVRTDLAVVRDIGTRFEVRRVTDQPWLTVRVRDGAVRLTSPQGADHLAVAEQQAIELRLSADGEVRRSQLPIHGEVWAWTAALMPRFSVEGRSLDQFLSWAAREGGWRLQYSTRQVATRAAQITLHGSIDGMTLAEATRLVLLSSGGGLGYRVTRDGLLVVGDEARLTAGPDERRANGTD